MNLLRKTFQQELIKEGFNNMQDIVKPLDVTLEKIRSFQSYISNSPQIECPLKHRFINGVYSREITMPKGAIIVSKLHKTENFSIITKGSVLDITEENNIRRIKAPFTMIVKAGTKRVLYIEEDTVWTTFHSNPTNTEDLKDLEALIIEVEPEFVSGLESEVTLISEESL